MLCFIYSPDHVRHDPQFFLQGGQVLASYENSRRGEAFLAAARALGLEIVLPTVHGPKAYAVVHDADYLAYLATAWAEWQSLPGAGPEVVPNLHPNRRAGRVPRNPVGKAGWYLQNASPIGRESFIGICAAADCALTAAERVLAGAHAAYAACRPPGHHAYADMASGFCFLNHAALAAMRLRQAHDRVAIVDIDVHHGNGTQDIFYRQGDVFTLSLHGDPAEIFPFYWGHADEIGEGAGAGANLNVPLPPGTGDRAYLAALAPALERVAAFRPGALVIGLGLDASIDDPFRTLAITTAGFAEIGRRLAGLGLPTVLVQEGGYMSATLGDNLRAVLEAFC